MRDALLHRGPDAQGLWQSSDCRVGLAHTRLAILDLSDAGAQPMICTQSGAVLVYNGEIYNYLELREYLEAHGVSEWHGNSDTEVLLKLLVREGLDALNLVDGMFAFGFYQPASESLWLGRDHLGEKPLYYALRNNLVLGFASETRALVRAGLGGREYDLKGLAHLMRKGSISPPHTHYADIRMLRPGHAITISLESGDWNEVAYWEHPYRTRSCTQPGTLPTSDELKNLESVIQESFRRRMRADVPVGAFLSGGVDSSFVCARLLDAGIADLHTFTVVMPGQPGDESVQAREISKVLGTTHREIPLELGNSLEWLEQSLDAMDVPSVDGPNTWLVSRAVASAGFKVACSGLGGDELFYGYPSFGLASKLKTALPWLSNLAPLSKGLANFISEYVRHPKLGRIIGALGEGSDWAALWLMRRGIFTEAELTDFLSEPTPSEAEANARKSVHEGDDILRQTSGLELQLYMHDQLLRDTDAMSMSHALEVRVPLISRLIVEETAKFSVSWFTAGSAKWFLKEWLARDGLEGFFDRPKQGFTLNWPEIWRHYLESHSISRSSGLKVSGLEAEHKNFIEGRHHYARSFCLEMAARQPLMDS